MDMVAATAPLALNIVFIGMNWPFSLAPLRALTDVCPPTAVIESVVSGTSPDRRSLLRSFASRRGIPFHTLVAGTTRPLALLRSLRPDLICVASMAHLLRPEEFELARLGAINLHPSLLPKYRGGEPFFWQAHQMDLDGGVTVHQIDQNIDTGDILAQERLAISLGEPFAALLARTSELGAAALVKCVTRLASGPIAGTPQRHLPCPFFAKRVSPEDRQVDWASWPIERAWHRLRAAPPWEQAIELPPGNGQWSIGSFERAPSAATLGSCAVDAHGYFLSHAQGKIRLIRVPPASILRRVARRVRRAIAPA